MRSIVGCATRRVKLAGTEGRRHGDYRNDGIMDYFWSTFRLWFVVPKRKAGPEEEVQFIGVVDAVRQSLEMVRLGLTVVTIDLQKTRPSLRQPDFHLQR